MEKLKKLAEQVGRRKELGEGSAAIVDGTYLKKGMKVMIKSEKEMLDNHYYENHPQKYKKLAKQIGGTVQEIEKIAPVDSFFSHSFDSDNVKLVGINDWIEHKDIQSIVDSAGVLIVPKGDINKLKSKLYDTVKSFMMSNTSYDEKHINNKEIGKIIRSIANLISKEK